jgi:hypothetical protein
MFSRRFLFLPVLAAAIGVPYALMSDGLSNLTQTASSWLGGSAADGQTAALLAELPAGGSGAGVDPRTGGATGSAAMLLDGGPVHDLGEVINFAVSPQWVTARWPRVSTVLSELEFEGMRVPLVTGPNTDDLAGSLTYYFDKDHRVRRIAFDGATGDPQRLIALVQQQYGLQPAPSLSAALYVTMWNSTPRSALLVAHPSVIDAGTPHLRYNVKLEINLPSAPYKMSDEFQKLLDHEKNVARW